MLQVKNISTGYGKKQVLFDVSLEVKPGEIVLLIGSNGSGKSTLLKSIYNLLPLFKGFSSEVVYNNEIITNKSTPSLIKKGLLYIPQKNICFDNLTVQENIEVSGLALERKQLYAERLDATLYIFPILKELLKQKVTKLSGGEKQIVAMAMASIHHPKMVLMDEPLTGLSQKNIEIVVTYIQELNKTYGTAFLIVEHRVKEIMNIGTTLVGLKLGKIFGQYAINSNFNSAIIKEILI